MTQVSVVIPTFNSVKTLEKCLASIKSGRTKYKYKVVLVNAGSSGSTLEIGRRYADRVFVVGSSRAGETSISPSLRRLSNTGGRTAPSMRSGRSLWTP